MHRHQEVNDFHIYINFKRKLFKNNFFKGNSPKKWELLLTEISNMECAIIQSKSIKAKLFPGKGQLSEEVK